MDDYGYEEVDATERADASADRGASVARALADRGYRLSSGVGFDPESQSRPSRWSRERRRI